ncbi:MAG: hypothetical protein ABSF54_03875 [Bryobacteraceae bacterium]
MKVRRTRSRSAQAQYAAALDIPVTSAYAGQVPTLEKLYRYEVMDVKARSLGYVLTFLVCFSYCVLNAVVWHRSERQVAIECFVLAAALSVIVPVAQVSLAGVQIHAEAAAHVFERSLLKIAIASVSLVVMGKLLVVDLLQIVKLFSAGSK